MPYCNSKNTPTIDEEDILQSISIDRAVHVLQPSEQQSYLPKSRAQN